MKIPNSIILILIGFSSGLLFTLYLQMRETKSLLNEIRTFNKIEYDEFVPRELLMAIIKVESNYNENAVGDNGDAVGILQIHKIYVDDVNKISGLSFKYEDRTDPEKSIKMARIYLRHYGRRYEMLTGNKCTYEVLARIHNGGPNGFKKDATLSYWNKIIGILEDENRNIRFMVTDNPEEVDKMK